MLMRMSILKGSWRQANRVAFCPPRCGLGEPALDP